MKNPITIDELQRLLEDEATRAEALADYFEYLPTGPFTGEYRLRNEIKVVKHEPVDAESSSEAESLINIRDFLITKANGLARGVRDKLFEERKQDGERIVIVTEGDSWFQYPRFKPAGIPLSKEVKDVIDYLIEDERFAVKSLGGAGDVIRNMFHMSEYLDAIEQYTPKAFVLSGGGNDFFEVFPRMVRKGSIDDIETFLKTTWLTEIEVIRTYYKGILQILTTEFPELDIFVHGYDYIMPRPDGKWIGRPMIETGGLTRDEDRKGLIKFIMDKFNRSIEELSEQYEKVHFINIRGTVPQDPQFWHDEIHPNDYGFRLVADKFIAQLEEVLIRAN
ncbi:GDSL-like lipase/acylhydrolase family protein [Neolewinella xylanilytica]|uniref:GDSL-like lipase/acylhydrolase family protein n=1 Tax=Neolewinella xylanilytica TaxID=1514080 RepID=A0A2S6IAD5_9BACT|nr:SGNH/GDSL hydrolase family protein [Neolewinella xylanilytica]PPK88455.1 GDSL-like lipase/acylhydrolase family protein [Neolewinella xylanilytica]